ncbi:hypothetical protein DFO54_101371 [Erwinia sp. AG740]|jgi:hypothetical protein|uniref:Uncharacterized protein n=1 Tax=Dickeya zeae (strain Ech586) TaxID=590409 RepID=D2BUT1_DICZ5|nr:hypothetical protein Dd586_1128 [Dickeya parazeae Ech586]PXW49142.1 hypothetical protein DFO54_101371 [Erwinia sp. AG740]
MPIEGRVDIISRKGGYGGMSSPLLSDKVYLYADVFCSRGSFTKCIRLL